MVGKCTNPFTYLHWLTLPRFITLLAIEYDHKPTEKPQPCRFFLLIKMTTLKDQVKSYPHIILQNKLSSEFITINFHLSISHILKG